MRTGMIWLGLIILTAALTLQWSGLAHLILGIVVLMIVEEVLLRPVRELSDRHWELRSDIQALRSQLARNRI